MNSPFKLCSICRKPIPYGGQYYKCSVSTCQRKRMALYFCQLSCFEAHLPEARHRDAWAELETAPAIPSRDEDSAGPEAKDVADSPAGDLRRRRVAALVAAPAASKEVLVVVSKLKKFIKDSSGMNTSDGVVSALSEHLRDLSIAACQEAAQEGRKTVLDRDYAAVVSRLRNP